VGACNSSGSALAQMRRWCEYDDEASNILALKEVFSSMNFFNGIIFAKPSIYKLLTRNGAVIRTSCF